MLKPALQLRLGQQLTMTPQLQQAIRLLQLPVLELQAQIREALEANVMLEAEEEDTVLESLGANNDDDTQSFDSESESEPQEESVQSHNDHEAHVEVVADSNWAESHTAGVSDSPWNNDEDEDRGQEFSDAQGNTLSSHLLWQLQLSKLSERDQRIGEAIIDALNNDGYLIEPIEEIALNLMPELTVQPDEVAAILKVIQNMDPVGVGARSVSECIVLQLHQLRSDTPGLNAAVQNRHSLSR